MLARTPIEAPPLTGLDRVMADCVANMPPFPIFPPALDMVSKTYLDAPCANPRPRLMQHHTPLCVCGYRMGEHSNV